eukprot:TRINITY_DN273_c0_g1_i2.p1 TRINITY_DN273_c0_g1~~TRINITY_DN273_c0_g1_i2.p1  ORF type:complete len:208 (+),score=75.94 TRINITY_DN273_c0_g1_i2:38-625(+)
MQKEVKCVVVGDSAVGKTTFLYSYVNNKFPDEYIPTVMDKYSADVIVDGAQVNLTILDTAGQEDYDRLRPLSYPQTDIFFLMYSVDNPSSYETIQKKYASEVKDNCPNVPIIVIATKTDLREDEETINLLSEKTLAPVSEEDGRNLSEKIGAGGYLECSALKNKGMNDFLRDVFEISSQKSSNNDNPKGSKCIIS